MVPSFNVIKEETGIEDKGICIVNSLLVSLELSVSISIVHCFFDLINETLVPWHLKMFIVLVEVDGSDMAVMGKEVHEHLMNHLLVVLIVIIANTPEVSVIDGGNELFFKCFLNGIVLMPFLKCFGMFT